MGVDFFSLGALKVTQEWAPTPYFQSIVINPIAPNSIPMQGCLWCEKLWLMKSFTSWKLEVILENLVQKARTRRLNALKHLAAQAGNESERAFRSVVIEFDRISRDPRFTSVSPSRSRRGNSNHPPFRTSRINSAVA